ncbi:MAG: GGDEF domain-containing protein [Campylobacterales bacterium]|nr:GGDEF domain-containing protein [Campylobacterales bacterium]
MKKLNIHTKLIILPVLLIVAIIALSVLFSQKIDRLKKEVDLIYFGNFTPVHSLHQIKEKYLQILNTKKISTHNEKFVLQKWQEYYTGYKTDEEMARLKKINQQLLQAFKTANIEDMKDSLNHINYLIRHEVDSAYLQRKEFLSQYQEMQNYLLYAQIIITLLVVIITSVIIYQAIKQANHLKNLNDKYKLEANTDGLTHLYNRKYFDTIFADLIPITKENNWNSVFVMIDIDFFKQYNDTYGHDAGDIALKKVAGVLDVLLNKEYEYPFRLGGEEFGIIIFNTSEKYVQYTLNNIQYHIKQLMIPHTASATGFLTLSMGVTMINEDVFKLSSKKIYTLTDEKLYHSKQNGRNQYSF